MSHHFDSARAKEDPRLNICDLYVFKGEADSTVMVMTTNADAGLSSPDTLHPEGLYAFRFDVDGDALEEVVFKFRFAEPSHGHGDEHVHVQRFRVLRATEGQLEEDAGELVLEGTVGEAASASGVRAFVGVVPELWTADAFGFFTMVTTLFAEDRFEETAFSRKANFFKNRNVMAIVLEVPNSMIGEGKVNLWGTVSLFGHAPEVQVYRWGYPLFTYLFLADPAKAGLLDRYHETVPAQDEELFMAAVAMMTAKLARSLGAVGDPDKHGAHVAALVCPSMMPYEIGTEAVFTPSVFNGRPLGADAFDVMLTLSGGKPVGDGVTPDQGRITRNFPYYGKPYTKAEQAGLEPIRTIIGSTY